MKRIMCFAFCMIISLTARAQIWNLADDFLNQLQPERPMELRLYPQPSAARISRYSHAPRKYLIKCPTAPSLSP